MSYTKRFIENINKNEISNEKKISNKLNFLEKRILELEKILRKKD